LGTAAEPGDEGRKIVRSVREKAKETTTDMPHWGRFWLCALGYLSVWVGFSFPCLLACFLVSMNRPPKMDALEAAVCARAPIEGSIARSRRLQQLRGKRTDSLG
jgi:hypothetical protein